VPPGYVDTFYGMYMCVMSAIQAILVCCTLGKEETTVEKLCSIMAHLEYSHQISTLHAKGLPF